MSKLAEKKAQKLQRLVESALVLFNEQGFASTTIDDIISKAKVGKGTFYLYFKNKEQLVDDVLESFVEELMGTLSWVSDQSFEQGCDYRAIYREQGIRMANTFIKHKELAIFLYKQARGVSRELDKKVQEFQDQLMGISTLYFAEAIQKGDLHSNLNPHITAMSVIGGINFTYQEWACGNVELDVESIVEGLLTFYNGALGLKF